MSENGEFGSPGDDPGSPRPADSGVPGPTDPGSPGPAGPGVPGPADSGAPGGEGESRGGEPPDPGELLDEVRAIRRRARLARHAYWFPLVLFGVLTAASVPFYLPPTGSGVYYGPPGPRFLQSVYLGGFGVSSFRGTAYYWLGAMLLGITATVIWYRWRGNRVGLRTPARGYLITGLIIVALALLVPVIAQHVSGLPLVTPGVTADLLIRGTFPVVLIGLGLCFLAWAERSLGLTVIAIAYLALALLASLYDIENVFYNWFGLTLTATASALPNVVLPALVLLLSGAGAWVVQRRHGSPPRPAETAEMPAQ